MVSDSHVTKMWDEACQRTAFVFLLSTHFFPTNKIKSRPVLAVETTESSERRNVSRRLVTDAKITDSLMNGERRQNRKHPDDPGLLGLPGLSGTASYCPGPLSHPLPCQPVARLPPPRGVGSTPPTGHASSLIFTH